MGLACIGEMYLLLAGQIVVQALPQLARFKHLLAKFSSLGNLIWGTYYGGNSDDEGYGVGTDHLGNVYITGQAYSSNAIATAYGYQTSKSGDYDAFLAKFSSPGSLLWATYYGGV